MARSQYKNHAIFASGEFNQLNGQWKPVVSIFWKNTTQKFHTISDLPGSFEIENEAIAYAFRAGRDWTRFSTVGAGRRRPKKRSAQVA
jgi:hypothetical protein